MKAVFGLGMGIYVQFFFQLQNAIWWRNLKTLEGKHKPHLAGGLVNIMTDSKMIWVN